MLGYMTKHIPAFNVKSYVQKIGWHYEHHYKDKAEVAEVFPYP